MTPESLPVRLRQARGTMSLALAAERSGVPADRIRKYEEGERRPYGKTLRRLADTYDVPVAELVGEDRLPARAGRRETTPAPPPERRRRRRRRVAGSTATKVVEVPVEVPAGETVRVVIELVIRPKASLHSAEEQSDEMRSAPQAPATVRPREPQPQSPPERYTAAPARPLPGRAASESRQTAEQQTRDLRGRRRRPKVPVPASGSGGASTSNGDLHAPGPDDPLEGFRQAYREFRREKG